MKNNTKQKQEKEHTEKESHVYTIHVAVRLCLIHHRCFISLVVKVPKKNFCAYSLSQRNG